MPELTIPSTTPKTAPLKVQLTKEMIEPLLPKGFVVSGPTFKKGSTTRGFSCGIPLGEIGFVIWNYKHGKVAITEKWNWDYVFSEIPRSVYNLEEAIRTEIARQEALIDIEG